MLLAAEHRDDVAPASLYYEVNVEARNVVQVMREHDTRRLIFTSTVAVYGLNRESPKETDKGKSIWRLWTEQMGGRGGTSRLVARGSGSSVSW